MTVPATYRILAQAFRQTTRRQTPLEHARPVTSRLPLGIAKSLVASDSLWGISTSGGEAFVSGEENFLKTIPQTA